MDQHIVRSPAFYAHIMNGLLLFGALLILYLNLSNIGNYQKIVLLILFSIGIGVHGLSHLGLEYIYGFNPLQ